MSIAPEEKIAMLRELADYYLAGPEPHWFTTREIWEAMDEDKRPHFRTVRNRLETGVERGELAKHRIGGRVWYEHIEG